MDLGLQSLSWFFVNEIITQYLNLFFFQVVNKCLFLGAILFYYFIFRMFGFKTLEIQVN